MVATKGLSTSEQAFSKLQIQWRRQLVGTWARAPLAFERIFSLGYTLKQVVWFRLVLYKTLTQHYLFSPICF